MLVAGRRPDLVASLTLISPAMPVYRVPPAFSRALLLLLVPGVPSLAARRIGGITPEESVRAMVRMCFGQPSRVPRERLEQAVQEMRERAEQPWADRALARSMRGLITSYLRVGRGQRLAGGADADRRRRWSSGATGTGWSTPRWRRGSPPPSPTPGCWCSTGVGHVAMLEAPEPTARAVLGMVEGWTRWRPAPR